MVDFGGNHPFGLEKGLTWQQKKATRRTAKKNAFVNKEGRYYVVRQGNNATLLKRYSRKADADAHAEWAHRRYGTRPEHRGARARRSFEARKSRKNPARRIITGYEAIEKAEKGLGYLAKYADLVEGRG